MEFRQFSIPGPVAIEPVRHGDARGYFSEIFRADRFVAAIGPVELVQENQSLSATPGTIRGLHFQVPPAAQGKLVRCVAGAIFDVAVDMRHDSPGFGKWIAAELSADNGHQLWVPAGFAQDGAAALAMGGRAGGQRGLDLEQSAARAFAESALRQFDRLVGNERVAQRRPGAAVSIPAISSAT